MSRAAIAGLIAVLATAAVAQEKLFESVEVDIANVDVVVADRDGRALTGLTKDDFEVYENGERQTITNFSEYRAESHGEHTAVEPPPRRFLLFIDNSSIESSRRKALFEALRRFVTGLRGGDEAGVVVFDRSLRVVAPMTGDKAAIAAAIDTIAAAPSPATASAAFVRVRSECARDYAQAISHRLPVNVAYQLCTYEAEMQTTAEVLHNRTLADAIRIAVTTIGGLDGKKALILAGTAMPLRPGYELLSMAAQTFAGLIRTPPPDAKNFEHQVGLFDDLARHASSYDVALYFLNPAQSTGENFVQDGAATPSTGSADFLRIGNTREAHQLLADGTGGLAPRERDIDAALASIVQTLDSYYSIGYKPPHGAAHAGRAIAVKAKNAAYTVRFRRTFSLKSAAAQMEDRVVANIYAPRATPEWPIEIHLGEPKRNGRNFVYPVEVRIPSTLTLIPRGEKLIGAFTLFVSVGTESGDRSSTFRQPEAFSIDKSEDAAFRAKPIPFRTTLTVSRGRNLVSVGVLDMISNTAGLTRTAIVTP